MPVPAAIEIIEPTPVVDTVKPKGEEDAGAGAGAESGELLDRGGIWPDRRPPFIFCSVLSVVSSGRLGPLCDPFFTSRSIGVRSRGQI